MPDMQKSLMKCQLFQLSDETVTQIIVQEKPKQSSNQLFSLDWAHWGHDGEIVEGGMEAKSLKQKKAPETPSFSKG